jgi:hypothetical protein
MTAVATPPQAPAAPAPKRTPRPALRRPGSVLKPWLHSQSVSITRHAAALRPFTRKEFGDGPAAPSEGHLQAANALITQLRGELIAMAGKVEQWSKLAQREPSTANLHRLLGGKEQAHNGVRAVERIWDFYFELFGQRQSEYAEWLLSCDRIALDCYKSVYTGLGTSRSVPAPPPFAYMRTGFSPATYRRGIPLRRLGRQINPFPLVKIPYHRLVNPWTLGALLHEVSHNLQNELGLEKLIPQTVGQRLLQAGMGREVAEQWMRWNRETFSDMSGLLLGGPAFLGSLLDVLGRSPRSTLAFVPGKPHPTPYLRPFLSVELLRRIGFAPEAEQYRRTWTQLYPTTQGSSIPKAMLDTFSDAHRIVVDAMCFTRYPTLGDRTLAQVITFPPNAQPMIEEGARRLAAGTDPGILPERYMIGAARFAFDNGMARPGVISRNFYQELSRR